MCITCFCNPSRKRGKRYSKRTHSTNSTRLIRKTSFWWISLQALIFLLISADVMDILQPYSEYCNLNSTDCTIAKRTFLAVANPVQAKKRSIYTKPYRIIPLSKGRYPNRSLCVTLQDEDSSSLAFVVMACFSSRLSDRNVKACKSYYFSMKL